MISHPGNSVSQTRHYARRVRGSLGSGEHPFHPVVDEFGPVGHDDLRAEDDESLGLEERLISDN